MCQRCQQPWQLGHQHPHPHHLLQLKDLHQCLHQRLLEQPTTQKSYNKNQQTPPATIQHPQFKHKQSKSQNQKFLIKLTFPSTSHSIPFSISLYGNESERSSSPNKNHKKPHQPYRQPIGQINPNNSRYHVLNTTDTVYSYQKQTGLA